MTRFKVLCFWDKALCTEVLGPLRQVAQVDVHEPDRQFLLDHIDLDQLQKRGIQFQSIKADYDLLDKITATAELPWGLLLSAVRHIPHGAAMRGHWSRDTFRDHQLSGKTLGILGVGRLGTMIAEYGVTFEAQAMTCEFVANRLARTLQSMDQQTDA